MTSISPVGDLGVGVALGADLDDAVDGDAELGAQPVRLRQHVSVAEHHLRHAADASRRSMKMTPPWSRRRATQPASVTVWPASVARNDPAV